MNMKLKVILLSAIPVVCLAQEDGARKNELAFGLGGIPALSRSDAPSLDAGSGVALQVNYGRRFLDGRKAALYGEINFLASPTREVSSSVTTATHDFASLYHARNSPETPPGVEDFALRGCRRGVCRLRAEHHTN
jgi:hypothetical protein